MNKPKKQEAPIRRRRAPVVPQHARPIPTSEVDIDFWVITTGREHFVLAQRQVRQMKKRGIITAILWNPDDTFTVEARLRARASA